MPEKPEVITVVNSLKPKLIGKKIVNTHVYWNNIIEYPAVYDFIDKIKNQTIKDITTRGKWIVVSLDNDLLLIHLRMEGKFFFRHHGEKLGKHEHVVFDLSDNTEWRFADTRKFGKMHLVPKEKASMMKPLVDVGKEFYDDTLVPSYLMSKFKGKKIAIKTALLDQSIIAGIGNIYDDEILFMSKINPTRKTCDVNEEDCKNIINNTKIVLEHAIKLGGTTIRSFTSSEGVHGLFQNELLVHEKTTCPECGSKLEKIKVNGRGTYYCSKCQPK